MSTPQIVVMSGLPGTGKSLISEQISKELRFPILSVDPIESAVIKSGFEKSFETGLAAYLVAQTLATEQLKLGFSVIIDAVNAEDEAKQTWIDLSEQVKVSLVIIECVMSDHDLHKQRINSRVRNLHGIDEVTWEKVEARRKVYTGWDRDILRLDMGNDLKSNLEKAINFIVSSQGMKN